MLTPLYMGNTKDQTNENGTSEKVKNLHFDVPDSFHRRVKMLCAMQGVSLKSFSVSALIEKVERDEDDMKRKRTKES